MLYLINISININKGERFVTLNKYSLMGQVYDNNNKCVSFYESVHSNNCPLNFGNNIALCVF